MKKTYDITLKLSKVAITYAIRAENRFVAIIEAEKRFENGESPKSVLKRGVITGAVAMELN